MRSNSSRPSWEWVRIPPVENLFVKQLFTISHWVSSCVPCNYTCKNGRLAINLLVNICGSTAYKTTQHAHSQWRRNSRKKNMGEYLRRNFSLNCQAIFRRGYCKLFKSLKLNSWKISSGIAVIIIGGIQKVRLGKLRGRSLIISVVLPILWRNSIKLC